MGTYGFIQVSCQYLGGEEEGEKRRGLNEREWVQVFQCNQLHVHGWREGSGVHVLHVLSTLPCLNPCKGRSQGVYPAVDSPPCVVVHIDVQRCVEALHAREDLLTAVPGGKGTYLTGTK